MDPIYVGAVRGYTTTNGVQTLTNLDGYDVEWKNCLVVFHNAENGDSRSRWITNVTQGSTMTLDKPLVYGPIAVDDNKIDADGNFIPNGDTFTIYPIRRSDPV